MSPRWLFVLPCACLLLSGCPDDLPPKPDATKGTVTGLVLCADTGKPARFAEVHLLPASILHPSSQSPSSDPDLGETAVTGLDGRFTIEAVRPGEYYAYATLDGYLDPERGVDAHSLGAGAEDNQQFADALNQWKDHLVKLTVTVQHTTELPISIARGAEIAGVVSYDDSSPAVGMHFELLRQIRPNYWVSVGDSGKYGGWSLEEKSDGRGRYRVGNLPAGEYKICAQLPSGKEESATSVCYGNTFRPSRAESVKAGAGEATDGIDIVIPLAGLYTVEGAVTAGIDAHAPAQATVQLLYADDREQARAIGTRSDGSFSFEYVPAGDYLLEITDAADARPRSDKAGSTSSDASLQTAPEVQRYLDKEIPLSVQNDLGDVNVQLLEAPQPRATGQ